MKTKIESSKARQTVRTGKSVFGIGGSFLMPLHNGELQIVKLLEVHDLGVIDIERIDTGNCYRVQICN